MGRVLKFWVVMLVLIVAGLLLGTGVRHMFRTYMPQGTSANLKERGGFGRTKPIPQHSEDLGSSSDTLRWYLEDGVIEVRF